MKKNSVKRANKAFRYVVFGAAAVLAVCAGIYNPGHLFTAAVVFAFGLECEPFKGEDYDIC